MGIGVVDVIIVISFVVLMIGIVMTILGEDVISALGLILVIVASAVFFGMFSGSTQYKYGQIDAINGKIKYELVRQSDGSTKWEEINK